MFTRDISIKAICLSMCVAWIMAGPNEDYTREFVEHVFRIPNPDKVLNSVLGRLEKTRQSQARERAQEDCDEIYEGLPEYTESMQSRERGLRHLDLLERPPKFYPICHLERKIRRLNTNEYEYRPAYFEEVRCAPTTNEELSLTNEKYPGDDASKPIHEMICSSLGFSCVQWNKTIHLTRRRYSSDCWEAHTMVIPAGCECMWPFHRLGDMNLHV